MTDQEKNPQESGTSKSGGPFTIYSAGGLFTQDELSTNVLFKEAVWRQSRGKFQLFLPQSRELQELDKPNLEAHIRNTDLLEVVKADIVLARFDGTELDSGTVVEYATAKFLGKPTVILRTDFRKVNFIEKSGPYNLMVKNWPRTAKIHLNSYEIWADLFARERQGLTNVDDLKKMMEAELNTLQKSVDEVATHIIVGCEAVLKMESPYPAVYQEMVYRAYRFSPGSGFSELMTEDVVDEVIKRLKTNGTL